MQAAMEKYAHFTASDFPSIRAVALEQKPSPLNPMGTKGAGEGGIIPVGGVVANAVSPADVQKYGLAGQQGRGWRHKLTGR